MNCIARHQPLLIFMENTSIFNRDTMAAPTKIRSHKVINALLPELMLGNGKNPAQMDPIKAQQLSKSFADLGSLVRHVQEFTSCSASVSMSKLHPQPRALKSNSGSMNRLTHNAVFTAHVRGAPSTAPARVASSVVAPAPVVVGRRRPQALKVHKQVFANSNRRANELKLDDTAKLRRRMEEYRKLKKTGRCINICATDSDDEDLEDE